MSAIDVDKLNTFPNPVPRMGSGPEPISDILARLDADVANTANPSLAELLSQLADLQAKQHKETVELTTKIIAKLNSINTLIK